MTLGERLSKLPPSEAAKILDSYTKAMDGATEFMKRLINSQEVYRSLPHDEQ